MDMLSAENRIRYLSNRAEFITRWVNEISGASETALSMLVRDIGATLEEKRNITFKVGLAKASSRVDEKMTILEAEGYVENMREMVKVNENVAAGLVKFVLGGVVNSSEADVISLYSESADMLESINALENRLMKVKINTEV